MNQPDYASLDSETLAKEIDACAAAERFYRDHRQRCEHELIRRMEAEQACEWRLGGLVATLMPVAPGELGAARLPSRPPKLTVEAK